ncbi:MAG: hypothetical protein ACFCUS_13460 [Rubrimonas sp.]|uniref:hypothetical protein n=1 Tax=Rubrimonas sp. TaxID=2036015 RepID=UPI002FDD3BBD
MLLKLITLIGVALAIWSAVRRAMGGARPETGAPPAPRGPGGAVQEMTRCPACGAWVAPDAPCACRTPPTP